MNKKINYEIELWTGIKHKIPLCCILFYESAWRKSIKYQIPEYSQTMTKLTKNQGAILCPRCTIDQIESMKKIVITEKNRNFSQRKQ